MKTDVILVSNDGNQMEAALNQTGKVAAYKKLSSRNELQLRLLAEEMMGMMRSITGKADGRFWIEDRDDAKGLMGRLRDFFERNAEDGAVAPSPLLLSNPQEMSSTPTLDWDWSMTEYQNEINSRVHFVLVRLFLCFACLYSEIDRLVRIGAYARPAFCKRMKHRRYVTQRLIEVQPLKPSHAVLLFLLDPVSAAIGFYQRTVLFPVLLR